MRTQYGLVLFTDSFGAADSRGTFGWALEHAREAEQHGWDELWTTEHHFLPRLQNSSALAMAAFLLGRTPLRVGTAVAVLPHHHPVALAEQTAVLQHLSGDRFTLGVGRGQPLIDQEVFGTGMTGFRDIAEPLALLERALRHGRAAGSGERYRFDEVTLSPEPPARRAPFVLASSSPESARLAGSHGVPVLLGPFIDVPTKRAVLEAHAAAAAEHGHQVDPRDNIDSAYFAIADDTPTAEELLTAGIAEVELQAARFGTPLVERPAPTPEEARTGAAKLADCHIAGDVAECRRRLADRVAALGVGRVLLMPEGAGSHEATLRTVREAQRVFHP
ncbi:LLM class flavin-dependent oxidoreductase [Saccharopolyspora hordei]|uniref:Alkanesulfonate monooxygenase SsuD/methylene tetrahydromethanopterin reductase-like flavin-dependent oxidoreductase (Luciferase family) n=1 Tax=Saccharopolyspora hordei TaxID=1838 RepID=A0A853AUM4_9PSEU|nr:LLM class flavin-dependent oxidoreductase [Saccharopolyspora hordei]NYI86331.1 alkanesulfonate monooxygenase SsuD/methylene tetrahydromethanopterin reductase-like flavin-dependent oxidoreductase (luciferase family) [Saccharopolyspora hordei]